VQQLVLALRMIFIAETRVVRGSFDVVEEAGLLVTDCAAIVVFVFGLETSIQVRLRLK